MCPGCNEWGTLIETNCFSEKTESNAQYPTIIMQSIEGKKSTPLMLLVSGFYEFDRVMGGGIMPGSLLVLTGDPGIGKSTLLMQIGNAIAKKNKVFYFSTEESLQQLNQRAERIQCIKTPMLFADEGHTESILHTIETQKPDLVIIDSIQNCYIEKQNQLNSITQLRDITLHLLRIAKKNQIAIIITGHITKEGVIAGPKTLEHMVDAVFYLQAEDQWSTRMLRAVKNRFGTIDEVGFFEMDTHGLKEVENINSYLIGEATYAPGSIIISSIEGSRPLLIELQALTVESKFNIPQRVVSGINHKQVMLIAAILQKYLHIPLNNHEIFVKISGGLTIKGSTCDLGLAIALLSSYFQKPLPLRSLALGEISLTGHIKPVKQVNVLIKESQKFGIETILVAQEQKITSQGVSIKYFGHIYELISLFKEL